MKRSKKNSALGRFFSKLVKWATDKFIESIPVLGPIYKVATIVNEIAAIDRYGRVRKAA
jgi:uncharacterized membrane protein